MPNKQDQRPLPHPQKVQGGESKLRKGEREDGAVATKGSSKDARLAPAGTATRPDQKGTFDMDQDITQKIREKAYEIWILEGRPDGRDLAHWVEATKLFAQNEASQPSSKPAPSDRGAIENAVAALDRDGE